ncbi:hypothetical protein TcasGA2_TC000453 [Tribolium castaneum]|uniref:Deltamethrin resistance protein prag01 domain-containing protein n=1 Tax=Tribolium castaneum TaxID=7070 RepID=D6WA71_TRICA|nr:PREDICTED: uncharacterized protein LOC100141906 [Tribolium castaneum]EEZ98048.1 hypothetical protein TcasGA2_TC000453 [Tribolium castaneum]|eukprot:XP_001810780.1 PREDICTED: uncharacterized protein LOC100141906 [Tribolium castaneum]
MQAPRVFSSLVARNLGRRGAHHGSHPVATINDLPCPQGNWKTHYDAKQRKYNAQLAFGIGALIGTIIFGKAAGMLEFHGDIPDRPADIPSYK